MKKLLSAAAALLVLAQVCVLPAFAAAPALSKWHAIQDENAPNRTVATAEKGRITVTGNFKADKEPGGCAVTCEEPIDLADFEVTFSLDQYTKCADQHFAVGFSSAPNTDSLYGDTEHPGFMLMLRPTDTPNEITCGEGLLTNWDSSRKKIRVGKSSFEPGAYFEGTTEASWTNIRFAVKRNAAGDGYDVYINNRKINNQNKWAFVDDIAKVTGGKWYLQLVFKDGNYVPATFTVKTVNGEPAVDKNASGTVSGSWGSSPTPSVTDPPATTAPATKPSATAPSKAESSVSDPAAPVTPVESSAPAPSEEEPVSVPDSDGDASTDSSDPADPDDSAASDGGSVPVDNSHVDKGGLGGGVIALIIVGTVIVLAGAGAAVYFLVIKKKAPANSDT